MRGRGSQTSGLQPAILPVYNVRHAAAAARVFDARGPLAQLVEHWTFNPLVAGSTPARPTNPHRCIPGT